MDPSLARGVKNQFFREISKEVDLAIERYSKQTRIHNAWASLKNWNRYVTEIDSIFSYFLIKKYIGGTKRKPFLCISTIDSHSRKKYNSWHEQCLDSVQLLMIFSPWHVASVYSGYSLSEHTIQRIFERAISVEKFRTAHKDSFAFSAELAEAPFWSSFWITRALDVFSSPQNDVIYPVIPTKSGLLFGEMTREKIHKVEIRTFVSNDMLFEKQIELKQLMLDASSQMRVNSIPFFPSIQLSGIADQEKDFSDFGVIVQPFESLLFEVASSQRVGLQLSDDLHQ
jgi:hypothetical protein